MKRQIEQLILMAVLAAGSVLLGGQPALAHSGKAAGWDHTLSDLLIWGFGVVLVLGALLGLLWLRLEIVRRWKR